MLDRLIGGGTPQKSGHMFVRIAHTELTASRTCPDSNETLLLLPPFRFIKVTRKSIKKFNYKFGQQNIDYIVYRKKNYTIRFTLKRRC
jgi:hypothetical protein